MKNILRRILIALNIFLVTLLLLASLCVLCVACNLNPFGGEYYLLDADTHHYFAVTSTTENIAAGDKLLIEAGESGYIIATVSETDGVNVTYTLNELYTTLPIDELTSEKIIFQSGFLGDAFLLLSFDGNATLAYILFSAIFFLLALALITIYLLFLTKKKKQPAISAISVEAVHFDEDFSGEDSYGPHEEVIKAYAETSATAEADEPLLAVDPSLDELRKALLADAEQFTTSSNIATEKAVMTLPDTEAAVDFDADDLTTRIDFATKEELAQEAKQLEIMNTVELSNKISEIESLFEEELNKTDL